MMMECRLISILCLVLLHRHCYGAETESSVFFKPIRDTKRSGSSGERSRFEITENSTKSSSELGWNWEMWWTYDGISGPEFWGLINPSWVMCSEGRRQSPINLDPRTLLYDPNLTPFVIDKRKVPGALYNTGHSLEWRVSPQSSNSVNLSGGPFSYLYTVSFLRLHFGERDLQGSEHTIANHAFPGELQLYGFNSQLYKNYSHASNQVYGVAGVSILVQLGDETTSALKIVLENLSSVQFGETSGEVQELNLAELIPTNRHYMTYEGSITEPGCHETVTWILPNKPLYISFSQMRELRGLRQGSAPHHRNAPLGNNFRPIQSSHHRTVRTNIDFAQKEQQMTFTPDGQASRTLWIPQKFTKTNKGCIPNFVPKYYIFIM